MFYENNKLVERSEEEIDKLKAAKTEHDFSFRCDSLSVGLTSACWTMALQSGITAALEEVFGKDGLELLRLGIYELCSHGEAMQNYEDWLCMNYLPGAKQLSSQQISDLLSKVNQEQIDQYFKMRYDRIAGKYQSRIEESKKNAPTLNPMTIAIDSTSIATYSESIGDAAFGHAKQDDFLKQINLTLCVDYETGDVCYGYESEGSINDMALFPELLMRMLNCGIDLSNTLITTDRGYSSILNVQKQINCSLKFLTGVKISEDSIKATIRKYRESLMNPIFMNGRLGVYARTAPIEKWTSTSEGMSIDHDVYVHLYHDPELGAKQTRKFMTELQTLLELKNNNHASEPSLWRSYSKFIEQNKNTKQWALKSSAVEKACRFNGYFVLCTNVVDDPFDALIIYRERNIVECAFRQFKVLNGGDRLRATATSFKGKLFIHMLAQSLRMMMSVAAAHHKADGKILPGDSLTKAMLQLQKLQACRPAGRDSWITKEIPRKTRDLLDLFGVPYPQKHLKY